MHTNLYRVYGVEGDGQCVMAAAHSTPEKMQRWSMFSLSHDLGGSPLSSVSNIPAAGHFTGIIQITFCALLKSVASAC